MKLYYPDYHNECMEESSAGLYYLASDVDARIEELNLQLLEQGGELGKCQENRGKNLETIRRHEARIAELEKILGDIYDATTSNRVGWRLQEIQDATRPFKRPVS